jgi:PAS domain S-box-containing protein
MLDKRRIEAVERFHSCDLLQTVLRHLPLGVIIAEAPSGRMLAGNDRVEEIWRHPFISCNDIEGYHAYKGFHPDGRLYQPEEWPLARSVRSGDVVSNLEIDFLRGDGTRGILEVDSSPIYDKDGSIVAAVTIFSDITERKGLEDQFRASRDELELRVRERTAQLEERSKELEELNVKLHELNQKISQEHRQRVYLSRRLVGMLERERREVAYVLHEKTAQVLAALKIELEQIESSPGIENVTPCIHSAKKKILYLIDSIKDTSRLLRPSILDTLGMVCAVRSLINRLNEDHPGLKIDLFAREVPERITPEKEIAIYRIIQEALTNCIKHAEPKKINVNLFKKNDVIMLTIEDDGKGFDYDSPAGLSGQIEGPLGITIMRERAVQLGGEFWIESAFGKGTYVSAKIPIG